jgi:hypothetical protein
LPGKSFPLQAASLESVPKFNHTHAA